MRRAERYQAEHTIRVVRREPAGGEAGVGVGDHHDRTRMQRGEPIGDVGDLTGQERDVAGAVVGEVRCVPVGYGGHAVE